MDLLRKVVKIKGSSLFGVGRGALRVAMSGF
jgi:hypothetical protein